MSIFWMIKDGFKMVKDKTVDTVVGIGKFLSDKSNRVVSGIIFVGLGSALIVTGYIKLPQ